MRGKLYYFGLRYEETGRADLAKKALRQFVEASLINDAAAYADAEAHLARLEGEATPGCSTAEAATVRWIDAR